MRRVPTALGISVASILALSAPGAHAEAVARFAVVVGNNHPETPTQPTLHFADDDALATHRLLGEAGAESVILATLDLETRRQNQNALTRAPRWSELAAALESTFGRVRAAARRGRTTEFIFYYSGHGDVARGEGYILLQDRRLTRTMLYEILARSPAARNLVLIDACKSYFLAFDKGPGGRRVPYRQSFVGKTPAQLGNTGFVLSTSTNRDSHEWERYQAGIFSHQLRSALRGAADINRDGLITYGELGAFLKTANENISSQRFRPDFMVRPPGKTQPDLGEAVLSWSSATGALLVDRYLGHLYCENTRGERLLDVHPARHEPVLLHLPGRPVFVRRNDESAEYVIKDEAQAALSSLPGSPPLVARKSAAHLAFEHLFAVPFGRLKVAEYRNGFKPYEEAAPEDVEDWPVVSSKRRLIRRVSGWTAVASAAVAIALTAAVVGYYETKKNAPQSDRPRVNDKLNGLVISMGTSYGLAGAGGLVWLVERLWPDTTPTTTASPSVDAGGVTVSF
jgi:hypothetical protein